jgi:drug/metabolite transporter (DMT)-like permease
MSKTYIVGLLCCVLSAIGSGPALAFVRLLDDQIPVTQILFIRGIFVALCLMTFFKLTGRATKDILTPLHPKSLIMNSVFWYVGSLSFMAALMLVDFAILNAVIMLSPMMIIVLARLFLGERISPLQQFGVAVAFCGVMVCILPDFGDKAQVGSLFLGLALAGFRMLTIGVTAVMNRFLVQRETMEVYMLVPPLMVAGMALSGLLYEDWIWPNMDATWLLSGYLVFQVGMTFAGAHASRRLPASVFSAVHYIQLPIGAVIGWLVFSEVPHLLFYPGAVIMVLGLSLATGLWRPAAQRPDPQLVKSSTP